ncbi:hypothetical protein SEVIR_3G244651v4 [Setaria viridis]
MKPSPHSRFRSHPWPLTQLLLLHDLQFLTITALRGAATLTTEEEDDLASTRLSLELGKVGIQSTSPCFTSSNAAHPHPQPPPSSAAPSVDLGMGAVRQQLCRDPAGRPLRCCGGPVEADAAVPKHGHRGLGRLLTDRIARAVAVPSQHKAEVRRVAVMAVAPLGCAPWTAAAAGAGAPRGEVGFGRRRHDGTDGEGSTARARTAPALWGRDRWGGEDGAGARSEGGVFRSFITLAAKDL